MSLDWLTVQVPFGYGLQQQADPAALLEPALLVCRDVEFSSIGGLQTRRPFASLGDTIYTGDGDEGGTLPPVRRLLTVGDELLALTEEWLFLWDVNHQQWVRRAPAPAVRVEEEARFASTVESVDCDRAELGGLIFYSWSSIDAAGVYSGYVAAIDKETGSVVFGPRAAGRQNRLVALSTRVLMFFVENVGSSSTKLHVTSLDPSNLSTSHATATVELFSVAGSVSIMFDAVRIAAEDRAIVVWRATPNTMYWYRTVTAGLTVDGGSKVLPCNGPIAVAVSPNGVVAQVVREVTPGSTPSVVGDLFDVTIGNLGDDIDSNITIGTGTSFINQIAACYFPDPISPGRYLCQVFWSSNEGSTAVSFRTEKNTIDTTGAVSSQPFLVRRLGISSRAFTVGGRVYLWCAFGGASIFGGANDLRFRAQLQNTYFLYRDDGLLVAKAAAGRASGLTPTRGRLPGVTVLGGMSSWLGEQRRIIDTGGKQHTNYAARTPLEISASFDDDAARRGAVIGRTLYLSGGEVRQYDGDGIYEVGFHVYPWEFGAIEAPAGPLTAGVYGLKCTLRWDNARGEVERSTTATVGTVTITVPPNGITIPSIIPLHVTKKTLQPFRAAQFPAIEVWRTARDPDGSSNFYLITSRNPAAVGDNRYLANDPLASSLPTLHDSLSDADLTRRETSPENGLALEPTAPPAASIIVAVGERLILAGIAGAPSSLFYSRLRGEGEIVAFNDGLRVDLPSSAGEITAVMTNGEAIAVFCEFSTYVLTGDGFNNDGSGSNYVAQRRSDTVGAISQECVCDTDAGIMFKSRRGWHMLNRGWGIDYIGGQVQDFDGEAVTSIVAVKDAKEVRILTSGRMLFFDSVANQWGERSIAGGVSAATWRGRYVYADADGVHVESDSFDDVNYGMEIETAWIKPGELQGEVRCRKLQIKGQHLGDCRVRVRIAYDYDDEYIDDEIITPAAGLPLKVQLGPKRQVLSAIKVRLTAIHPENDGPPIGTAAIRLTGIAFQIGVHPGLARRVAASQKA